MQTLILIRSGSFEASSIVVQKMEHLSHLILLSKARRARRRCGLRLGLFHGLTDESSVLWVHF